MTKPLEVEIKAPSQTKYLGMIGRIGESLAYSLKGYNGSRRELAYHLNLVLTEAVANAICHANHDDPDKDIRVSIAATDHELLIRVYDQGQGFDIKSIMKTSAKPEDEGGRGIQLIYKLMDEVDYLPSADGNVLQMKKVLDSSVAS